MLKKARHICAIIFIFILVINIFEAYTVKNYANSVINAMVEEELERSSGMSDVSDNVNFWEPDPITDDDDSELIDRLRIITGIIQVIGIIVSVITLSVIGIKFMLGSVEERAQYKQTLIPWLIGAVLLFVITTLPSLIYTLSRGMFKGHI